MSARTILIVLVVSLLFVNACAGLATRKDNNSNSARGSSTAASKTTGSENIGIPECDDFIAKYNACISDHVPAAKRVEYKENIDAFARAWKQQMANTDKNVVAAACKRHSDITREKMKPFGCEF